ncbi:MAG: hypothetical protein ABSD73_01270 [Candidatus Bathyarchaeia archaeon]
MANDDQATLALVFDVRVSAIFALYAAWRASMLKPVETLRYKYDMTKPI